MIHRAVVDERQVTGQIDHQPRAIARQFQRHRDGLRQLRLHLQIGADLLVQHLFGPRQGFCNPSGNVEFGGGGELSREGFGAKPRNAGRLGRRVFRRDRREGDIGQSNGAGRGVEHGKAGKVEFAGVRDALRCGHFDIEFKADLAQGGIDARGADLDLDRVAEAVGAAFEDLAIAEGRFGLLTHGFEVDRHGDAHA